MIIPDPNKKTKKVTFTSYYAEGCSENGYDLYARISKEKDDNTTSLTTQVAQMVQYCKKHDIPINLVVEEDYTGTLLMEREGLTLLRRRYMTGQSRGIVFWKFDRATRKLGHFNILDDEMRKHKVDYHCVMEQFEDSAIGRLSRGLVLSLAEYERENILLRTALGKRARVEIKGKLPGCSKRPRYGFDYFDKEKTKLVINEKEAEIVVEMFTMRANGYSVNKIAKILNERGVLTATGKKWENTTIRRVLDGGEYWYRGVGVYPETKATKEYRNGKLVTVHTKPNQNEIIFLPDGVVPRIISDELYFKAREVDESIKQDNPKANKNPEEFLLRGGFIRCGGCGGTLVGHSVEGKTPYYVCGNTYKYSVKCKATSNVTIPQPTIDNAVWEYVSKMVQDISIVHTAVNKLLKDNSMEKQEESANLALEECTRKLKNYWRDLDIEDEEELRAEIRQKIKDENKTKKAITEELSKIKRGEVDRKLIKERLEAFIQWAEKVKCGKNEEVDYKTKRDRLRFLGVVALVYPRDDTGHERFEITTRPKDLVETLENASIKEQTTCSLLPNLTIPYLLKWTPKTGTQPYVA